MPKKNIKESNRGSLLVGVKRELKANKAKDLAKKNSQIKLIIGSKTFTLPIANNSVGENILALNDLIGQDKCSEFLADAITSYSFDDIVLQLQKELESVGS